jgi:carboxyl-terminal processing protease
MRGEKGSAVKLGIYREGFDKVREISVKRDIIKIASVKSDELEAGYGYVRLSSFTESAGSDMKKAIAKLDAKHKLRGLVFDLRYNPGGLLDQAVDVSSLFIDDGVIVSTIGRNRDQKEVKYARKGMAYKDFPVAILVNSSTASAAEIVSGALQDHHRAIIMGQTTFGKGSVQQLISLGNDLGLKLTIARYYTPSGRSIQEKGVQPDIVLDEFDSKLLAQAKLKTDSFRERDLKGHMVNTDAETSASSASGSASGSSRHDEFKKEELEYLGKPSAKGKESKDTKELLDDDMAPLKMNPREDYQVREALNYLKSYDVFRKLSVTPAPSKVSTVTTAQ